MNENKVISFKPKPLIESPEKMDYFLSKVQIINERRPKLRDFKDIYSDEDIKKNEKEIENYNNTWNGEKDDYEKFISNFSKIYEAGVIDTLDKNKTLGEGNEVIPTSEYDNIFNGIDGVFIMNKKDDESEYLGLNMDVTFSSVDKNLEKKIESIKQCIRIGILPTLKYFQDPRTKEHKKISLPKIIIGSQQSSADGFVRLWGETNKDNSEVLKNHPIQSQIIMEALTQLIYFYNFAKSLSENTKENDMKEKYEDICYKYGQMYNYFHDVYESKKDLIKSHYDGIVKDTVYQKLVSLTEEKI